MEEKKSWWKMEYLIGLIALLTGGLFYFKSKADSNKALTDNLESKEKVNENNAQVLKNEALSEAESIKRKELKSKVEQLSKDEKTNEELANYFNKSDKS